MSYSCRFSFDDLFQARFGREMSQDEKDELYALSQKKRNKRVGEWAKEAGWYTEDRKGSDGVIYTAFWNGGEKNE
jgi:hypothetical protein